MSKAIRRCFEADRKMVNNGHITYMPSDTIRGVKPTGFYEDEYYRLMAKKITKIKSKKPKK